MARWSLAVADAAAPTEGTPSKASLLQHVSSEEISLCPTWRRLSSASVVVAVSALARQFAECLILCASPAEKLLIFVADLVGSAIETLNVVGSSLKACSYSDGCLWGRSE
eukprot:8922733-Pyramimonas_sp.AAC.1